MKVQDYKDREVQMVSYEFDQETDREGQMTGIPRFQMLRVRVKALNDGTPELMAWMCDRFLKKDGEIQFLETKTLKVMKTIKFTGAYCVDFEENWADKEGHYELVNYKFNQATDQEGQVSGIVRGGQITIRVKALNDGNPELLAWMIDPAAPHDLTVEFENTKDGSAMKTLKGTGCYCIHYKEYWADGEEHYEEILISCQNIEVGSVKFENAWA